MKSSTAAAILALVSASVVAGNLARPEFIEDNKPNPKGATFLSAGQVPLPQAEQRCIEFKSSVPNWYYKFAGGPWGDKAGKGQGSDNLCVPVNDGPGGAMYIGPDPNPGPGSTKLECKFPSKGQAFCDVSLVDGYSLSLKCTADKQTSPIGGDINLYKAGRACPKPQGPNCINEHSNDANQSTVDAFFQPATKDGNDYCIWKACDSPNFPVESKLTCTVSGGK